MAMLLPLFPKKSTIVPQFINGIEVRDQLLALFLKKLLALFISLKKFVGTCIKLSLAVVCIPIFRMLF
jgi:hypothetical protein